MNRLDLKYVYDFDRERYSHIWAKEFVKKEHLSFKQVKDALALPPNPWIKNPSWRNCSILNNKNALVPQSFLQSWGCTHKQCLYEFDKKSAFKYSEPLIYLGPFINHWGHWLIETSTRLWYALQRKDLNCFFITYSDRNKVLPQIWRFLELSGIEKSKIIFISKPTYIEEVYIPEQSYIRDKYYSEEYLKMFSDVANNICPTGDTYDKIYLSRTKISKKNTINEIGIEMIDELFINMGFKIIYPEETTLDNQICYLIHACQIATICGTCSHNLLFVQNMNKKVYIVKKYNAINTYETDICKLSWVEPIFCDFYVSKYPLDIASGPYLFVNNINMKKFIKDNNIDLSKNEYFNAEYTTKSANKYNILIDSVTDIYQKALYCQDKMHPYFFSPELANLWLRDYQPKDDEVKYKVSCDILNKFGLLPEGLQNPAYNSTYLIYDCYVPKLGWLGYVDSPATIGRTDENYKIEAIRFDIKGFFRIFYEVGYARYGWTHTAANGGGSGFVGRNIPIEGVRIWLGDLSFYFHIEYRAFLNQWSEWFRDGEKLVSPNGIKALQARLIAKYESQR